MKKNNVIKAQQPKGSRLKSNVTKTFRKIISAGSASDISKELLNTAIDQVSKAKDDISSILTGEIIDLVRKIDFVEEFSKFAETHKFKISMEVEISKKDKAK